MARVILDTNNVLGATDTLPTEIAGPSPQEFATILVASRRYPQGIHLVCDGAQWEDAPKFLPEGLKITFSGHGVSADDVIARVVSQSSISRHLLVITTDRQLQRRVKRLGASTMDSAAFLKELGRDWLARTPKGPSTSSPTRINPNEVLPPDLLAEAERIKRQKVDLPSQISGKVRQNSPKSHERVKDPSDAKPLPSPQTEGFSFDPDTLKDAERIAKGEPPNET